MKQEEINDLNQDMVNDLACSECGEMMEIDDELMKCPACGNTIAMNEIDDTESPAA